MSQNIETVEEAAAAWDARLRGTKVTFRDRRAFHTWLRQDAAHQAAHDRLQAMLAALRAHADMPELSALRDEARASVHATRRRRFAAVASLAAAAVLVLALVTFTRSERSAELAAMLHGETIYATAPDERARVTLADGSILTLDMGTKVAARIGAARRDVTLLAGRALFQVAKDPQRPFVVRARGQSVTALGTVFDVRLAPREVRVTLAEGSVAVRPLHPRRGGMTQQVLKPHQQFVAIDGEAAPRLRTVDTDRALAWADGQLFFDNEPLARAVEEMNEFSPRKIRVDPAVAGMRINGMFRTSNQAGFLEALEVTLPVEVHHGAQGNVYIVPKAGPGTRSTGDAL